MKNIIIAMSGGIDSSIAAFLVKKSGYNPIGISLNLISNNNETQNACCSHFSIKDAREVCYLLNMPFYVINANHIFKEKVIKPFIASYIHGTTPNPCLNCNFFLKFKYLYKIAKILNADLATGHYAIVTSYKHTTTLKRAIDITKDQTYYLYNIPKKTLDILHLPIGNLKKHTIRKIAKYISFKNYNKHDSQGICFTNNINYSKIIVNNNNHILHGNFINNKGKLLSKHNGIHQYTIGQHKKIKLLNNKKMYVININYNNKQITLGNKNQLQSYIIKLSNVHYIININLWPNKIYIQIRSHGIKTLSLWELSKHKILHIKTKNPLEAIAPGQATVIYDKNILLGGGTII